MKARITKARVMTGRMIREKMISIMAWGCTILVLLIRIGSLVPKAAAQSDKTMLKKLPFPRNPRALSSNRYFSLSLEPPPQSLLRY